MHGHSMFISWSSVALNVWLPGTYTTKNRVISLKHLISKFCGEYTFSLPLFLLVLSISSLAHSPYLAHEWPLAMPCNFVFLFSFGINLLWRNRNERDQNSENKHLTFILYHDIMWTSNDFNMVSPVSTPTRSTFDVKWGIKKNYKNASPWVELVWLVNYIHHIHFLYWNRFTSFNSRSRSIHFGRIFLFWKIYL